VAVVVAIDAGTTGVRAFAVDETGAPVGWSYREFPQHFPQPGWVEHDANDIWDAVQATLAELRSQLAQPIAAIGITDQRETVVVWDRRTGEPLHRAIVWQDRRTAARCDELRDGGTLPLVRERTGLVLDPYFSGTKLEWLLREGGVEATANLAFGTVDSWVLWKLTGGAVHATEPSNASRTLLYDIRALEWSAELCDLLHVPMSCLPEVRPSCGRFGVTMDGIPVSGIAGDQQAALFGQACVTPGMAKNTYGTGSFLLMNVGTTCPEPVEGLLTTVGWTIDGQPGAVYALEGAVFVTGAAVQWLRDGLQIIDSAADVEALAASVDSTDGVYLVPAFTGLGSPWWDPYARGTVVGITRGTTRAHLARATLDAIAFQTRDVVEAMCRASGERLTSLRADGGASANGLLLQLQSDQLQAPVQRPVVQETTALGAAYLAGLAEGVWSSLDEVGAQWRLDVEVTPAVDAATADAAYAGWTRAVDRSLRWSV
jgi:glycerol kinase